MLRPKIGSLDMPYSRIIISSCSASGASRLAACSRLSWTKSCFALKLASATLLNTPQGVFDSGLNQLGGYLEYLLRKTWKVWSTSARGPQGEEGEEMYSSSEAWGLSGMEVWRGFLGRREGCAGWEEILRFRAVLRFSGMVAVLVGGRGEKVRWDGERPLIYTCKCPVFGSSHQSCIGEGFSENPDLGS